MTEFFVPDRSDRPESLNDYGFTAEVREVPGSSVVTLCDGRPSVTEAALVDAVYSCHYWYFDATGLEGASKEALADLLARSGIDLATVDTAPFVGTNAKLIKDARGRDIWEFQAIYDAESESIDEFCRQLEESTRKQKQALLRAGWVLNEKGQVVPPGES